MENVALILAGSLLVLAVLYDLVATTVSLSAVRGPVSTRLSALVWRFGDRSRSGHRRRWRTTGPVLVVAILLGWLILATIGWTMVFTADGALSSTASPDQQSSPIRWVDALFFVIGRLIGGGSTDLQPDAAAWSVAVALMQLSGLALLTLSIAWVLPVVGAAVQKRALASKLSAIGATPEDIVLTSWTGRGLGNLDLHLLPLVGDLALLAQRHLAYPVIHYFHSRDDRTSIAPRLAALDDALTIIEAAGLDRVDRDTGLDVSTTRPVRQAISDYLSTLDLVFITTSGDVPPAPPIDRLVEAGVVEAGPARAALQQRVDELHERRSLLLGYVRRDGWTWDAVCHAADADTGDPEHTG